MRLLFSRSASHHHALDPQSIPTEAAVKSAKVVVDRLLERQMRDNNGQYPETIACVLWGTDNKHQNLRRIPRSNHVDDRCQTRPRCPRSDR